MNLGRTLAVLTGLTIISAATAASAPAVLAATGLLSLGAYLWSTSSGPIAVKDVPEFDCGPREFNPQRSIHSVIMAYRNHEKLSKEEMSLIRVLDKRIVNFPQEPIVHYSSKTNSVEKSCDETKKHKTYFHTFDGQTDKGKPCTLVCTDGKVMGYTSYEFGSLEEDKTWPYFIDGADLMIDGKRVFPRMHGAYRDSGEVTTCKPPKEYLEKGEHVYAVGHETMEKLCQSIHLGYVPDNLMSEEEKKRGYAGFDIGHVFENPEDERNFLKEYVKQQGKTA